MHVFFGIWDTHTDPHKTEGFNKKFPKGNLSDLHKICAGEDKNSINVHL